MIAISILSANFSNIKEYFPIWESYGAPLIHFDVMDNHFVPNLTFGYQFINDLKPYTSIPFDIHLMISNPYPYIPQYLNSQPQYLSAHIEAFHNQQEILETQKLLKNHQIQFGLAIKPNTPPDTLIPFIHILDYILVMTVEPGFGAQLLINKTLDTVIYLDKLRKKNSLNFKIQVDGGINENNLKHIKSLGANIAVMGSAFFKSSDPKKLLQEQ